MFQNFFSDYLVKLQESNQQWWKDFEQGKAAVNSPLTKAMQELNAEDTAAFMDKASQQPAAMLDMQTKWWNSTTRDLAASSTAIK